MKLTNQEIEFLLHRYGDQIKSRAQVCAGGNFRKSDVREIENDDCHKGANHPGLHDR